VVGPRRVVVALFDGDGAEVVERDGGAPGVADFAHEGERLGEAGAADGVVGLAHGDRPQRVEGDGDLARVA